MRYRVGIFLLLLALSGQAAPVAPNRARLIRQVFDKLTYAFANNRPKPALELIGKAARKPTTIVLYVPGNQPVVRMDEEVYELCRSLGRDSLNALAVLLGHELAHHYEKHDWTYAFGIGQVSAGAGESGETVRRLEAEADFYGCFYGELAGYATGAVFPRILDLIYARYKLPDQLPNYPDRADRKAIYRQKQAEALDLADVFRVGQVFYWLKEYELSIRCFDLLTNRFPSREMFANLSAANLQQALTLLRGAPTFAYPIELDPQSRLASVVRSGSGNPQALTQYLIAARQNAEKAKSMDPTYVPAYVNLACAYSLAGNQNAAIGVINELPAALLTGDAHTIRAIAYYRDKQVDKAADAFTLAQQQHGYMAEYNQQVFGQLEHPMTAGLSSWIQQWFTQNEAPGTLASPGARLLSVASPGVGRPLLVSEQPYLRLQRATVPAGLLVAQTATKTYQLQAESGARAGKAGSQVPPTAPQLVSRFGRPTYEGISGNGRCWVYRELGLIVLLDDQNKVIKWNLYTTTI